MVAPAPPLHIGPPPLTVYDAGNEFTARVNDEDELTQPFAFFTVRLPVYVPAAVLAGTVIVIGLAGKAALATAAKLFEGDAFQVML